MWSVRTREGGEVSQGVVKGGLRVLGKGKSGALRVRCRRAGGSYGGPLWH